MYAIQSLPKESLRFKKLLLFKSPAINRRLLVVVLAGVLIIETIFYVKASVDYRLHSVIAILDPLLPSGNINK